MVETTEVLEEQEGVDWLRDFPQFEPADLEFSDWEADAWDNEFALGNFDLVGNNFPVFFIRDGMKFPDMVHALKPNPKSHIQENWRVLDFFSHHPESLHMFTFLFDDIGIPQDYRHMDGSGVNTYTLINKAGKAHYVKFHWRPTCGGVVAICALEGKGGGGGSCVGGPGSTTRDSNTVGLRGGRRGRRPQTASYRKSKESTRVTNASDVAEVHYETSRR
ncbi:hypothetical protein Sjap_017502 [Stephania japonica]|uniref:catalase n=1 Tax=Stephania japonica TaxID=461633 RepID=A0AAP0I6A1_9MAGN